MRLSDEERKIIVSLEIEKPIESITKMEQMREESDYNCTYDEEPEVLQRNIVPAKKMIDTIAAMVKE